MALLRPTLAPARAHRSVRISLPSAAAAAEVGIRSGGLLRLEGEDGQDATLEVQEVDGRRILASGDIEESDLLNVGQTLVLSWTEPNDWATVAASVKEDSHGLRSVVVDWPPTRRQRREFRRFALLLPLSITIGLVRPAVYRGHTRDVSGGGVAAHMPDLRCLEGDAAVALIRCDGRDVLTAATVKWVRPKTRLLALEFSLITPADQDYLVGLVARSEARRGW